MRVSSSGHSRTHTLITIHDKVCAVQGPAAVVLCALLGQFMVETFLAPDKAVFCGRGGAQCIAALLKFNQGYLFPLQRALLFIGAHLAFYPRAIPCSNHLR